MGFPSRVAVEALEVEVVVQLFDENLEENLHSSLSLSSKEEMERATHPFL